MQIDRESRGERVVRLGVLAALLCAIAVTWSRTGASEQGRQQAIPVVWDEEALKEFSLPLPNTDVQVEHITPEY